MMMMMMMMMIRETNCYSCSHEASGEIGNGCGIMQLKFGLKWTKIKMSAPKKRREGLDKLKKPGRGCRSLHCLLFLK